MQNDQKIKLLKTLTMKLSVPSELAVESRNDPDPDPNTLSNHVTSIQNNEAQSSFTQN